MVYSHAELKDTVAADARPPR
eukprot:COSAG06_NODE_33658_length_486_cov_1.186047_2_plen_20_part_01